jgi:hypothetical protein
MTRDTAVKMAWALACLQKTNSDWRNLLVFLTELASAEFASLARSPFPRSKLLIQIR